MLTVVIISILTSIIMILSILFFPKIKIEKISVSTYWIVSLIGAFILIIFNLVPLDVLIEKLTTNTAINPIKILTLFISMTFISVFLDEAGFFKHLACLAITKAKNKQIAIFISIYVVVSILTVFTSNDIIILTFTPFICYFCKNAKINPIPYLVSEFVAANTWSMMLIIGNPTNIYLGTIEGILFLDYLKVMALPTFMASIVSFIILYFLFRKELLKPIEKEAEEDVIKDKFLLYVGLIHLSCTTILLAISSYIGLEMWIITLSFALSLLLIVSIYLFVKKKKLLLLEETLKRTPWSLIPFVLSMFVIVLSLTSAGFTKSIAEFLGTDNSLLKYGVVSFLTCNIINNIPMCVLFSEVLVNLSFGSPEFIKATYAVIAGSNIGAFFTPVGALAGIMWMSILKDNEVKFKFFDFMKYGLLVAIPTLIICLLGLALVL